MNESIRSTLLVIAFVACLFNFAWLGALALLVYWATQNPGEDAVYLFFKPYFRRFKKWWRDRRKT